MPLTSGTSLGPYQIDAPLGAGGMGEVYKATDTRLDRTVAIKVLPAHVADDPDLRQRFEREAKTISSLNHPHICTLYDIGNQDGIDFLVMEYLDGETRVCAVLSATGRRGAEERALAVLNQGAEMHALRRSSRTTLGIAVLVIFVMLGVGGASAQTADDFVPVTDAVLLQPSPDDWLM